MNGIRVVDVRHGEPYDLYIGRANPRYRLPRSPWANPFRIGPDGDRDAVLARFEAWLRHADAPAARFAREHLHELRGLTLACWCAPPGGVTAADPLVCHGQVHARLLEEAPDPSTSSYEKAASDLLCDTGL